MDRDLPAEICLADLKSCVDKGLDIILARQDAQRILGRQLVAKVSSTYPIVKINGVNALESSGRWGLDPSQPPRVTNVPTIQSVSVPGRDGLLWTPQGAHPSPLFTVTILIAGVGSTPDEQFTNAAQAAEEWGSLASTPQVPLEYWLSASEARYATGRVASFDVTQSSLDWLTCKMVFELVQPFWWTSLTPTVSTFAAVQNGADNNLTGFTGTAPVIDSQFRVTGPAVNPTVTATGSGDWVHYEGTVATGETWRFDATTLRSVKGSTASVTWTSGGSAIDSLVFVGGSGSYIPNSFRLTPSVVLGALPSTWVTQARLNATGLTSASKLEVSGRKAVR